jgi:DNA primase
MKMDEQSLFAELNKALLKRFAKRTDDLPIEEVFDPENPPAPQPIDLDLDTTEYHEKEIIRLLLNYGNKTLEIQEQTEDEEGNKQTEIHTISVAQFIHDNLSIDNINFENEIYQKIFDEYSSALLSGNVPSADYFIHYENSEIAQVAIDLSTFPYSLSDWKKAADITVTKEDDNLEVVVKYVIYSFKLRKINKMISEIQKQLHEAQSEEEIFTLISQQKIFENAKKNFAKELTWVVLR